MAKKTAKKDEIKAVVKPAEIDDETQPKPFIKPKYIFGRPTKYNPAFCQFAVDHLALGFSRKSLAGNLAISLSTLQDWITKHEDFAIAVKIGQSLSADWWEAKLRDITNGEIGNASTCIFGVKNRSQEEWQDKHEVNNISSDGTMTAKPTTINIFGEMPKNHDE